MGGAVRRLAADQAFLGGHRRQGRPTRRAQLVSAARPGEDLPREDPDGQVGLQSIHP
jgi:hypothetical protein